jgi:hypothetical protein
MVNHAELGKAEIDMALVVNGDRVGLKDFMFHHAPPEIVGPNIDNVP